LGEIDEIDSWWPFFDGSSKEKSCSIDFVTSSLWIKSYRIKFEK
jgi:hypothetical protein